MGHTTCIFTAHRENQREATMSGIGEMRFVHVLAIVIGTIALGFYIWNTFFATEQQIEPPREFAGKFTVEHPPDHIKMHQKLKEVDLGNGQKIIMHDKEA